MTLTLTLTLSQSHLLRIWMSFVKAVRAVLPTRAYPGRAQRALYGGKLKQFGNHVSFSNNR